MARLTLARKIAAITLIVWKKGVDFDAKHLKQQAACASLVRESVPSPEDLILGGWPFGFLRCSVRGTVSTESLGHVCLRAPSLCCYPMRPRITEQSYRPRVSDRTMRYRLFKADNRHLLVSFRRPNGVVTTRTWNHSGEEQKVSRPAGKDHTLTDRVCTFKTIGLNAETKKSVGIEPTGEIFLLTFTLIGRFCEGQSGRSFHKLQRPRPVAPRESSVWYIARRSCMKSIYLSSFV